MAQRDYGFAQPLGIPGGIYDLSDKRIVTRTLDKDVVVKTGMGMIKGTKAGETVTVASAGATKDKFEGVVVHGSVNLEHGMDGTVVASGYDTIGLMQNGSIWAAVAPTATTTYGTNAALILAGEHVGMFTSSDDAKEASKVALDAIFTGKADADNGIAVIRL